MKEKGYTIIELIVPIAIISIMIGVILWMCGLITAPTLKSDLTVLMATKLVDATLGQVLAILAGGIFLGRLLT